METVAKAYQELSPQEQTRACIFASNYGEAGAIDFLGRRWGLHLPPAISGQNNYWLWGTHGCDPNLVIAVIPDSLSEISQKYESVTIVGRMNAPYAMPFERQRTIYLLRGRRASAPFRWSDERYYF